jgi:hypothetical protein
MLTAEQRREPKVILHAIAALAEHLATTIPLDDRLAARLSVLYDQLESVHADIVALKPEEPE